jgi:hypothetical protein
LVILEKSKRRRAYIQEVCVAPWVEHSITHLNFSGSIPAGVMNFFVFLSKTLERPKTEGKSKRESGKLRVKQLSLLRGQGEGADIFLIAKQPHLA